ncbi:hypothetical protein MATL_G00174090 [Megalops atlanticus]|uniref:Citrate synthase-lysine N-methyltransferase CSKMT, mitochondrial n=1 Tax=Megalops atlanticus TaxID=7932 RepID=A0A9D3PPD8_MEGAT|nr:hypothetical protein MATL_G00174090 [Megalops atlanticus]
MAVAFNRLALTRLPTLTRSTVAPACRHHNSMTADLINNMDKKETWDRFYQENNGVRNFKNFEWFFGFDAVRDLILPLLQPQQSSDAAGRVLDMGCGTSALGPGIFRHSPWPVHVTCADISPVAVRLLKEQSKSRPVQPGHPSSSLTFLEMDCSVLQTQFDLGSLDLIIDKGTTDALLRSREGRAKAGQILRQCLGVLRQSGCLLQFSDEDPDARMLWLEGESGGLGERAAGIGVQEVGVLRGVCYYCYLITPPSRAH